MEIWKDVIGYEGIYQVSNMGRVKRIKQSAGAKAGRVLKETLGKDGYNYVKIYKEGLGKRYSLSRGVATAFIPNPENKPQVNHKNGIKTFNWPENLEWITSSENHLHAIHVLGFKPVVAPAYGERNGMAKLKDKDVLEIRKLLAQTSLTQVQIGKKFNISQRTVSHIKVGDLWKHVSRVAEL